MGSTGLWSCAENVTLHDLLCVRANTFECQTQAFLCNVALQLLSYGIKGQRNKTKGSIGKLYITAWRTFLHVVKTSCCEDLYC